MGLLLDCLMNGTLTSFWEAQGTDSERAHKEEQIAFKKDISLFKSTENLRETSRCKLRINHFGIVYCA